MAVKRENDARKGRSDQTVNTAAPTTAHKKLVGILLTIVFALTCLPAALAVDLNVDAGFYFKQSRGGTCTLASAAMMLRYSFGMTEEADAIENAVNKVLDKGLRTADNMSEGCTCLGCTAMGDAILAEI